MTKKTDLLRGLAGMSAALLQQEIERAQQRARPAPAIPLSPPPAGTYDKSACLGKQAFPTKAEALRIMAIRDHRNSNHRERRRVLRPYRCAIRHLWHLGGQTPG